MAEEDSSGVDRFRTYSQGIFYEDAKDGLIWVCDPLNFEWATTDIQGNHPGTRCEFWNKEGRKKTLHFFHTTLQGRANRIVTELISKNFHLRHPRSPKLLALYLESTLYNPLLWPSKKAFTVDTR